MEKEQLIEQLAELKAATTATNFMLMIFLEHSGCHPESLIRAVDALMLDSANKFENAMRAASGLPPREVPRLAALECINVGLGVDWSDLPKN